MIFENLEMKFGSGKQKFNIDYLFLDNKKNNKKYLYCFKTTSSCMSCSLLGVC